MADLTANSILFLHCHGDHAAFGRILCGRHQDTRTKAFIELEEKLNAANQNLQNLVTENTAVIEKQRDIENKISNAKRTWEVIFDSINDMIVLTDQDHLISRCNRAAIDKLNVSFQQILGQDFKSTFVGVDGRPPAMNQKFQFKNLPGWFYITTHSITLQESQSS